MEDDTEYAALVHSASAILLLALAILFIDTSRGMMSIFTDGGPGGVMARRLLPGAILLPIIVGWIVQRGEMISRYEGRMTVEARAEHCRRISDQGIGIPSDDLPHIFEPFKRGSNTGEIDGTGLGMAIVYESLTLLGGSIRVDSVLNEGTTFTVRLPYLRAADQQLNL